jgi:3-hydroxyacyl-[acyl-carrier-protein] dehydratase
MTVATWTVPVDHPAFGGHFPGRPILPGVVLLDRVISLASAGADATRFMIGTAKFLSPAGPGETLEFRLAPGAGDSLRFDVASGGRAIATGTLTRRSEP